MRDNRLIQKYSFIVLGISLSLPIWIQSKIVFLFVSLQIIIAITNQYRISKKGIALALLFISLFLTGFLSLIYSLNLQFGLTKSTTQLVLVIIPMVVIIYGQERIRDLSPHFYQGVIAGNLFIIIYIAAGLVYPLLFSDLDFVSSNSIRILHNLLHDYNHRTYIGIALIAGYLSFNSAFNTAGFKNFYLIRILYAILIWAILFLLGARSIILVYSIILIMQVYISWEFRKSFFISLLLITCYTLLFSFHPRLSNYITSESTVFEVIMSNVRYDLWKAAWGLIKESPVFGYGLGDGQYLLIESTAQLERVIQFQLRPDAHNQFIQSWLDCGVVGPIIVLGIMLVYVLSNKNMPNLMRFGLPLLFSFTMLFEVILYRLSGVILFTTFFLFPPTKIHISPYKIKIFYTTLIASLCFLILFGILSKQIIKFDSTDPSTYMSLDHSEIEYRNLPGDIPDDISVDTKGCLLNKNSFEKQLKGNLFAQSIINESNVRNGDSVVLTVYCYIGESFNGDQVRISGRGQIQKPNDHYANMKIRDQWQFLSINTTTVKGRALLVLTLGKHHTNEPDSITGEVIFVDPTMRIIKR
ncbi:MAG: O-antigen ligase family protein [Bacteroidales bacterium]|nr:O-antigen ligase family protein [Bacteroidales bacterium]